MYGIYLATWVVLRPSGLHAHDYSIIWEEFISFVCRGHNILVLFFAMFIALFCVYVMGFTLYKYIYIYIYIYISHKYVINEGVDASTNNVIHAV